MADARKTISKSSAASRVKKIAKNNPSYQEIREILNRARQEKGHASDRAAAIMGGAMIEDALRVAIKRTFDKKFPEELLPDLFEPEKKGPLSTLGYRILVGYALGVFGPITYSDLSLTLPRKSVSRCQTSKAFAVNFSLYANPSYHHRKTPGMPTFEPFH